MFNFDKKNNEKNKEYNLKMSYIPNHPYRVLIIGGSGSTQIKDQNSNEVIDKIYLYDKDLSKPKYQLLIKKVEDPGIKHLNDPKAFKKYSKTIDNVYNNIDNYNPKRNSKSFIVFEDMIADINTNM